MRASYIPSDGKFLSIMSYLGRLRKLIFLSSDNLVLLTPGVACQPAAITKHRAGALRALSSSPPQPSR